MSLNELLTYAALLASAAGMAAVIHVRAPITTANDHQLDDLILFGSDYSIEVLILSKHMNLLRFIRSAEGRIKPKC